MCVDQHLLVIYIHVQCPYWEGLQNIKSRLDHTTQAVEASVYHGAIDYTRGHIPLYGFADKNIIKDTRFKLICALRTAGLANSSYAKSVMEKINPKPHLAIHGLL